MKVLQAERRESKAENDSAFVMNNFDDTPIDDPSKDIFGLDSFARAISNCIQKLRNPVGSVVAIYGPWGSGKSSAIKLVLRHLSNSEDIDSIEFPAWMYRSEDALTVGFFKELHAGLSSVLSKKEQAASALRKLGITLVGAGNLASSVAGLIGGSPAERGTTAIFSALENFIQSDETIEDLQGQLADALKKEEKQRFLVVIDDLDRLAPEEALVIFRLIKSVGRLPNVMYLLAYDKDATEKAVAERFPSEGPHYLEKIVQAGFELPEPDQLLLNTMMKSRLIEIAKGLPEFDPRKFDNFFNLIVAPELKTPRDVIRLANVLSITVEPVKNEIFFPDFMGLETLRMFRPGVYCAIRANKFKIFKTPGFANRDEHAKEFSSLLLKSEEENDHERLKEALMLLFPQLYSIFFTHSSLGISQECRRQRRVCVHEHFDTYFQFEVSLDAIPREELDYLFDSRKTFEDIRERFNELIEMSQANDRLNVFCFLEELAAHCEIASIPQIEKIFPALFSLIDKLFIALDKEPPLPKSNQFYIYQLLQKSPLRHTTIEKRSEILMHCLKKASLQWLSDFSRKEWINYHTNNSGRESDSVEGLLTKEDAEILRERAIRQIETAATDGTLIDAIGLSYILFAWDVLKADGSNEVYCFTANAIADDQTIVKLARAFLARPYVPNVDSTGSSSRHDYIAVIQNIERLLDIINFRTRLESLENNPSLPEEDRNIIVSFMRSWRKQEEGGM